MTDADKDQRTKARLWTHEPPTRPGFYWMAADRGDGEDVYVQLVHVTREHGELVWFASVESGLGAAANVLRKDTVWWSSKRIPFPAPPALAADLAWKKGQPITASGIESWVSQQFVPGAALTNRELWVAYTNENPTRPVRLATIAHATLSLHNRGLLARQGRRGFRFTYQATPSLADHD